MSQTRSLSPKRLPSNFPPVFWLFLLATFALLWELGAGSLAAWDEAIYAQVSKEAAQGGGWLTPRWGDAPWFEKPPLLMWVTALFYRLFGVGEFWARVPSALSGITLLGVTYLIGKLEYGERVGFLSAVVLLTCYHFLSFSRFGTTDVMLTLFTYLALYAYLRLGGGDQRWWCLVWASCALALMVKGAGGIIAPAAVVLTLVFDRRFSGAIRSRHFWQGCLLALLLVAPWHVLMYVWHGRAFVDEYVGYHVIARSTSTLEGHASGYFYYVGRLVDGFFPWCLLVPFAVFSDARKKLKEQSRSRALLLLTALVFGLYTVIPTRRPWYIVPLYPALSILVAAFITNLYRSYQSRPLYRRTVVAASVLLVIGGGSYSFVSLYLKHTPEEPVAKLARLARSTSQEDKAPLLLFSETERFYAQVPLFYSDRPVRQTYASSAPSSVDARRYVNYENLADVVRDSEGRMILHKNDIRRLATDYDIRVLAEADPLIYATIKRKQPSWRPPVVRGQ
jgi:4-amino-4-deoxy-L-arabinose transferase-like glycosyltransferase